MIRRSGIRARTIAVATVMTVAFASPSFAACPKAEDNQVVWVSKSVQQRGTDDGIGGSGRFSGGAESGDGVGGSGRSANPPQSDDGVGGSGRSGQPSESLAQGDEDGVGGSGHSERGDEDGVGGSGLFGTITGFGSICINGRRIGYDSDVPVTYGGEPASAEDLDVGQVVRIVAGDEQARSIDVVFAVVGEVEEASDGVLTVMGQRVQVAENSMVDETVFVKGSRVAVSGLRHPDGSIIATRVEPAANGQINRVNDLNIDELFGPEIDDVDIEGYVHAAGSGTLDLGAVRFAADDLDADEAKTRPKRGDRVHVRGPRTRRGHDPFRAHRVEHRPGGGPRLDFEGRPPHAPHPTHPMPPPGGGPPPPAGQTPPNLPPMGQGEHPPARNGGRPEIDIDRPDIQRPTPPQHRIENPPPTGQGRVRPSPNGGRPDIDFERPDIHRPTPPHHRFERPPPPPRMDRPPPPPPGS